MVPFSILFNQLVKNESPRFLFLATNPRVQSTEHLGSRQQRLWFLAGDSIGFVHLYRLTLWVGYPHLDGSASPPLGFGGVVVGWRRKDMLDPIWIWNPGTPRLDFNLEA